MGLAQASARLESQASSGTSREVWKSWGGGGRGPGDWRQARRPASSSLPSPFISPDSDNQGEREGAAGPGAPTPGRIPKVGSQASELCGRAPWSVGLDMPQSSTRLP